MGVIAIIAQILLNLAKERTKEDGGVFTIDQTIEKLIKHAGEALPAKPDGTPWNAEDVKTLAAIGRTSWGNVIRNVGGGL